MSVPAGLANPELETLRVRLEDCRRETTELLTGLPDEELNRIPAPNVWSIGQQFDHLDKSYSLILPDLQAAVARLAAEDRRASGPFRYGIVERMFIEAMNPSGIMRVMPMTVPPIYEPAPGPYVAVQLSARIDTLRVAYLDLIRQSDGLDLTAVRIPSKITDRLQLCTGAWLHSLIAHDRYHLNKALALRKP